MAPECTSGNAPAYQLALDRAKLYDSSLQNYLSTHSAPVLVSWEAYAKEGPNHGNEDRIAVTLFDRWLHSRTSGGVNPLPPRYLFTRRENLAKSHEWFHQRDDASSNPQDALLEWQDKLPDRYPTKLRSQNLGLNSLMHVQPQTSIYSKMYNSLKRRKLMQFDNEAISNVQFGKRGVNLGRPGAPADDSFMCETYAGQKVGVDHLLIVHLQLDPHGETNQGLRNVIVPSSRQRWIVNMSMYDPRIKAYRIPCGSRSWTYSEEDSIILNDLVNGVDGKIPSYSPVFNSTSMAFTVCDGHDQEVASQCIVEAIGRSLQNAWHRGLPAADLLPSQESKSRAITLVSPTFGTINGHQSERQIQPLLKSPYCNSKSPVAEVFEGCMAGVETIFRSRACEHESEHGSELTSGSCVISTLLVNDVLYTAELGDSMACVLTLSAPYDGPIESLVQGDLRTNMGDRVPADFNGQSRTGDMGFGFQVVWLSRPMRCDASYEQRRIFELGGAFGSDGRLGGLLEPTRSIGDFDVKMMCPGGVLSIIPEVSQFRVKRPCLLFVGSDGPFDVLGAEEILGLIQMKQRLWVKFCSWMTFRPIDEWVSESCDTIIPLTIGTPSVEDLQEISKLICKAAVYNGSRDDCSMVVSYLCPILGETFRDFQQNIMSAI